MRSPTNMTIIDSTAHKTARMSGPLESGFTKFEITPGGGGKVGVVHMSNGGEELFEIKAMLFLVFFIARNLSGHNLSRISFKVSMVLIFIPL